VSGDLDLQSDEDESGINFEGGLCDDSAADIHQGMEDLPKRRGRPLQHNDEGRALEAFVRQIQECDDALSDADGLGALSIDVQSLWLAGELEDNAIKVGAHVWSRNGHASTVRKGTDAVARKDGHEEVKGILFVLVADRGRSATVAAVIGCERRGG